MIPVPKSATFDASDFPDDESAEQHAKEYSRTVEGYVAVNVHPMDESHYVHFLHGEEIYRATPHQIEVMREQGIQLLNAERRAERFRP